MCIRDSESTHQKPRPFVPHWMVSPAQGPKGTKRHRRPAPGGRWTRIPEQRRQLAAIHRPYSKFHQARIQMCRNQPRARNQPARAVAVAIFRHHTPQAPLLLQSIILNITTMMPRWGMQDISPPYDSVGWGFLIIKKKAWRALTSDAKSSGIWICSHSPIWTCFITQV